MITRETISALARRYQTSEFPNIVREYFQHLFVSALYRLPGAEKLLFKGGTAFRIVYGSPRFSEDLDFSLTGTAQRSAKTFVEDLFLRVLAETERTGSTVRVDGRSDATSGGYCGAATFRGGEYPPVGVEINVSTRNGKTVAGEADSIVNDFVPAYTVVHLPQEAMVEEKIFGALVQRKKPRDFYDLYFLMRKGMLTTRQKLRLGKGMPGILADARRVNFKTELGTFLPIDQQGIIRDFAVTLEREMKNQLSGQR